MVIWAFEAVRGGGMIDEERIRDASERLPYARNDVSLYVRANAISWHVAIALPGPDRRHKYRFLYIGKDEIEDFCSKIRKIFKKLEAIRKAKPSEERYANYPIEKDISITVFSNDLSCISLCDRIAIETQDELESFVAALNLAPGIGSRLHELRKVEFQAVQEERSKNAQNVNQGHPQKLSYEEISSLVANRNLRKVHDWEISDWQGNPSERPYLNSASIRKSKAQSRKRTALRTREAEAASLPWKILLLFLTIIVAWVGYSNRN